LTDYEVDGQKRTINDGNKDLRIAVGKTEFTKLQQYFNKNRFSYDKYMNRSSSISRILSDKKFILIN
jgi:hypothetical protein